MLWQLQSKTPRHRAHGPGQASLSRTGRWLTVADEPQYVVVCKVCQERFTVTDPRQPLPSHQDPTRRIESCDGAGELGVLESPSL